MNKIGRRTTATMVRTVPITNELLASAPEMRHFAEAMTAIGQDPVGRWLPWRPVSEPVIKTGIVGDDFLMNTVTVMRRQDWEMRFIGRRRRPRR